MNKKRGISLATIMAIVAGAIFLIAGCGPTGNNSGLQKSQHQQQIDENNLENNQPLPYFSWSQERATLIIAEQLAANGASTTSFGFQQGISYPTFVCPSVGYGVPDSSQLSNPDQNYNASYPNGGTSYPIPQEDPYGVYTPSSSAGTWVVCVAKDGSLYAHRAEENIDTVDAPAVWTPGKGIVLIGAPSEKISKSELHAKP